MSLVTRCTSCGTLFKVVADQLKVSQGWVRCGQCGTVFDAQSHLVEPPAVDTSSASAETPAPISPVATESPRISTAAEASLEQTPASESPSVLESGSDSLFQPGKLRDSDMLDTDAGPSSAHWVDSSAPSDADAPASPADTAAREAAPAALAETPSFVKQAQRAQRWRSPWVRLSLSMLSLALLALLAAQITFMDKDRIAAQWPQSQPFLQRFCEAAGCSVQPLRRIESISVDASQFNRINKNNPLLEAQAQTYRLSLSLKNVDALPLAMPHVELSLQDAQDQVVLRRILTPADLGIALATLAPGQDASGSTTLQVSTSAIPGSRIQGYRVLAFYP